jgi:hypothetical protein
MMHLEFSALQMADRPRRIAFDIPTRRLQEIIAYHESHGAIIFNPHAYTH